MDGGLGRLIGRENAAFRHLDPTLLITSLVLSIFGIVMIFSASHNLAGEVTASEGFFRDKQIVSLMLGLIAMIVIATFDYRLAKVYAFLGFGLVLFLLLLVLTPIGDETAGAQRWITLFGFQFQPSEFAKLTMVAALAGYLSEIKGDVRLDNVWRAAAIATAPMVLIFLQPDIGTMMVFAATLIGLLVVVGARARYIAILLLTAIFLGVVAFHIGIVKDYQIARLTSFLDPEADPLRAGYNRQQAEIAIGSGGILGRGYLAGTQTNLDFVPEQHTDFVFTVVGEELGFAGAIFVLGLYGILIWRGFRTALMSRDSFGTLLAAGISAMLAFQVFVNIGMTMGIMPVTGIPLPLVSYGGTAMITNWMAIGLLLNVHMRRFK
ncbi:MAG: rod shape-determining protein RodA [Actinomycetota bacterium]